MSKIKALIILCVICLGLSTSSCRKFLDVNQNPNVAQTATPKTLLPAAQLYVGTALGVDLQINGSIWAQYWDQSPQASQYRTIAQLYPGQDAFSTPWSNLYAAAENFYQLSKLADSLKQTQYLAISLVMQAYTFQLITDGWGDVPYTQALQGQYADGHVVNPKYDSQKVVYKGIIKLIDSANKIFNPAAPTSVIPAGDDLLYGLSGTVITKWQKFANTLKLKVLMRLTSIEPTIAADSITAFLNTSPSFIGTGDDAYIGYGWNTSNQNPLYSEEVGLNYTQNLIASNTCIDTMINNNDPRLPVFYNPDINTGNYGGLPPGSTNFPPNLSYPTFYVGADVTDGNYASSAKAPVIFMSAAESYLLQAEAITKGYATSIGGVTDDTLFYYAIKANFSFYNAAIVASGTTVAAAYSAYTSGASYWANYPTAGTPAQKLRFIITQKWLCMCGNQGFEAWTEWRRTGYPDFLTIPLGNGTSNQFPRRFTYPTSESTVNSNYPGLQPITAKVWWNL